VRRLKAQVEGWLFGKDTSNVVTGGTLAKGGVVTHMSVGQQSDIVNVSFVDLISL
jgi:hypothetical protein